MTRNETYKQGEILILTREVCEFLESLNLSYADMTRYLAIKLSPSTLANTFLKYGIKHKSKKTLIKKYMRENPDKSLSFVAIKFNVSRRYIVKIKGEIKNDKGKTNQ